MTFIVIITIVFMLMLTIVPATSLTIRPQLSRLYLNVIKRCSVPCMSLGDMKTKILSAVVVPMLVLSSSTVSPSFAESAASKDIASITRLDKAKQSVVSKQASDRSSGKLSDRVEKNENNIIEMLGDIKYLTQDMNEVKIDIRGIVVAAVLLLIRSEFKDNEMRKEMEKNKAESDAKMEKADAKMEKNKAESDAKMDRNFIITTGISAGALLVSLVMTLATKK